MTSEVVVMNRLAIALAADSAVTIGKKVYNTANKLFTLSKVYPVGIMIYGNGEFVNVPWELIIKLYRKSNGGDPKEHLEDYATDFLSYIESDGIIRTEDEDEKFQDHVDLIFLRVSEIIDEAIKIAIDESETGNITEDEIDEIANSEIEKIWRSYEQVNEIEGSFIEELLHHHETRFAKSREAILQKLPISDEKLKKLKEITCHVFVEANNTGIVIAGYGEKDLFPGIINYSIHTIVGGSLKYQEVEKISITKDLPGIFRAFAQGSVATSFIQGIDPDLEAYIRDETKTTIVDQYPEELFKTFSSNLGELDDIQRQEIYDIGEQLFDKLLNKLIEVKREKFVEPIAKSVAVLPKDELGAMAESLVNITSLKRRVSMDVETVGGEVDVAIISKGDGFVWVKRKHYFKPELNHHFFKNYSKS